MIQDKIRRSFDSTQLIPPGSIKIIREGDGIYLFNPETLGIYKVQRQVFIDKYTPEKRSYCFPEDLRSCHDGLFPIKKNDTIFKKSFKPGLYIIIYLSNNCNLRCIYCYRSGFLRQEQMSLQTAKDVLEWIVQLDKRVTTRGEELNVIFFGGEPLLNKDVLRYLITNLPDRIINSQLRFGISTNGTLIDCEVASLLKEHNARVQISIDGNSVTHNSQRPFANGYGSYDQIICNLKHFDLKYQRIIARVTVSKRNLEFYDQLIHLYKEGFRQLSVGFVVNSGDLRNDVTLEDMPYIKREFDKTYDFFLDHLEHGELIPINPIYDHLLFLSTGLSQYCCGATQTVFAFNCSGQIYPCQRLADVNKFAFGTAIEGINEAKLNSFRENPCFKSIDERCQRCWIKNICAGKCYFFNFYEQRSEELSISCVLEDTMLQASVQAYIRLLSRNISFLKILLNRSKSYNYNDS